jgi:hypothetical protein
LIERNEAPELVVFIDQADLFEVEDFEAMFFKWQPSAESADTDSVDESPQMPRPLGARGLKRQMGELSMATKKTAAKSAKKPMGAGARTPAKKSSVKKK